MASSKYAFHLQIYTHLSSGYGGYDNAGYPDGPPPYDDRHPADDRGPRYKRERSPPPRDRDGGERGDRGGSPERKRQRRDDSDTRRSERSRSRDRDREVRCRHSLSKQIKS